MLETEGLTPSFFEQNILNIKIMHWNILADKLAINFDKVPKDFLKWEYRFELIK
jgi:mRNA deadenylase 3'-5' endonuclease subunit Ccr4